jgi:hypothetical protein
MPNQAPLFGTSGDGGGAATAVAPSSGQEALAAEPADGLAAIDDAGANDDGPLEAAGLGCGPPGTALHAARSTVTTSGT